MIATRADAILKLSLAAAALMAGAGVGYYYGLFLPQHTQAQQQALHQQQKQAAKDRAEAARKATLERTRQQQAAQLGYQDCVNFAQLGYRSRWNASCRSMHEADIEAYQDCLGHWFASQSSCARKHPIRAEKGCDLPADIAAAYADDMDKATAQCRSRFPTGELPEGALPDVSAPASTSGHDG